MKRLATILFLLVCCSAVARDIKVSVVSAEGPVGYAYVYINGRIFGSASEKGVLFIPDAMLRTGDQIGASFVGAGTASTTYSAQAQQKGEVMITLKDAEDMDEIVVTTDTKPIAHERLFRKMVNRRQAGKWLDAFQSDFRLTNDDDYALAGTFYRAYLPPDYINQTGEGTVTIKAPYERTLGDTLYRSVSCFYVTYLFGCVVNAGGLSNDMWFNDGMVIKYMGRTGNVNRFFVTRPKLLYSDTFQTIISADAITKEVVNITGEFIGTDNLQIDFTADYRSIPRENLTYPSRITGSLRTIGDQRWDIHIENITYDERPKAVAASFKARKK